MALAACRESKTESRSVCTLQAGDAGDVVLCGDASYRVVDGLDHTPGQACSVQRTDAGVVVTCGDSSVTIPSSGPAAPGSGDNASSNGGAGGSTASGAGAGGASSGGSASGASSGDTPSSGDAGTSIYGSYRISNSLDVATFERSGATTVLGDLIIDGVGLRDLSGLHNLTSVGGRFEIHFSGTTLHGLEQLSSVPKLFVEFNSELVDISAIAGLSTLHTLSIRSNPLLTAIAFPNLTALTELTISYNAALTSVAFPALETVGPGESGVVLQELAVLTSLSFPLLRSAASNGGSGLVLGGLPQLASVAFPEVVSVSSGYNEESFIAHQLGATSISLPKLEQGGLGVRITNNAALTTLAVPALSTTGKLRVENNPLLTAVSCPELTSISTALIKANAALTGISLPLLSTATTSLTVTECVALTSLALPALSTSDCFQAFQNPELPQCAVDAILGQLASNSCASACIDNDSEAVCN